VKLAHFLSAALLASGGVLVLHAQAPQGVETFDAAWTIVRDSHFDKSMNGVNWDAVRTELRPRAAAARTASDVRAVVRDMLGRLGQSHFALIPSGTDPHAQSGGNTDVSADLGFDVRLVGRDLLVTAVDPTGPGAAAGVRPGWKLSAIGEAEVPRLLRDLGDGTADRLTNLEAWRTAETRLRGAVGSVVSLTLEDASGKPVTLSVERRPQQGQPVTVGHMPTMFVRVDAAERRTPAGGRAGVIRFNVWMAAVDGLFQHAMDTHRRADGIVVDLRGNPGGLAAMIMGISGHFVGERTPLGVMKTRDNELRFVANPRLASARGERVDVFAGPVAILVDALTGSASECFAGGMQSIGRARVFGQTSMGQALPALFDRLPNGDVLIHAYGDFVTADGTRLEGRGVIPDEIVPLRRDELLAGRDRPLEAALEWIDRARGRSGLQHP
jgi:carboxyl-terminal processing protease